MQSHSIRDRLVYPVAAIVALGLVSVPHSATSVPRIAEVSAIRLQAEVTSYVGGLDDRAVSALAAAASATAPGPAAATAGTYPSTFLDKLVYNLPPQIQSIVLPPLYVVAAVIGAIVGLAYLVVSPVLKLLKIDPFQAAPAAAESTATHAATASTATEPITAHVAPKASSATPGEASASLAPASLAPASSATPGEAANPGDTTSPAPARPARTPALVDDSSQTAPAVRIPSGVEATDVAGTPSGNAAPTRGRAAHGGSRGASAAASPAAATRSVR